MTLSPFHGIFSALKQEQAERTTRPLSLREEMPEGKSSGSAKAGQPVGQIAVDIYEVDDYYIIRAPIAGVKLSDLDIEVDGNVITIRGRRITNDEVSPGSFYVQECFWGDFVRAVTLPTQVDPRKIKATFSKDGILKILVPKEEKIKIVRISEN